MADLCVAPVVARKFTPGPHTQVCHYLLGRKPGDHLGVADLRGLRFEVLGLSECFINGFDLVGVEFVSGVVNEQRREGRDTRSAVSLGRRLQHDSGQAPGTKNALSFKPLGSRDGRYSTAALRHALAELDADELSLELRIDDGEDD